MKNKLNLSFLKNILSFEFFILETQLKKNVHDQLDGSIIKTTELLTLLKSLKQFIRLLQYLKRTKQSFLEIISTNPSYSFLLNKYLNNPKYLILIKNEYLIVKHYSILNKSDQIKKIKKHKIIILLEQSFIKSFLKDLNKAGVFLASIFDHEKTNRVDKGLYNVPNSINTHKKIVFFISIINRILLKI